MRAATMVLLAATALVAASCSQGEQAGREKKSGAQTHGGATKQGTTGTQSSAAKEDGAAKQGGDYLSELGASMNTAQRAVVRIQIASLSQSVELYEGQTGKLPARFEDLQIDLPKDPWGNTYRYALTEAGRGYRIWSLGPDGRDGTPDDVAGDPK